MNDKNTEEKAKRYVLDKLEENGYRNFHGVEFVEDAYTTGYNQALTDQSDTLTQYKEALRELVEGIEGLPPLKAIEGVLEKQYSKAKHLLKDE